jgi:hypothetical protein
MKVTNLQFEEIIQKAFKQILYDVMWKSKENQ